MKALFLPTLQRNLRLTLVLTITIFALVPVAVIKTIRTVAASLAKPSPDAQADFVQVVPLRANKIVYSPTTKMLYASVPSSAGAGGNSIKTIDPASGSTTASVFIGSEPDQIALASDGTTLYAALDGAYSIRRFDVSTQTPGAQFPLGSDSFFGLYRANDLAVAPGNPNLLAVARQYPGTSPPEAGVAIFDNGVQRPTTGPGHISGSDYLSFSSSATTLYGTGLYSGLTTLTIDANGVSITGTSSLAQNWRIKFDNGLVYAGNGQVIDPSVSNGTLKGTFAVSGISSSSLAFVPESATGRAYYLTSDSTGTRSIRVFDINTFIQIGSIPITGLTGEVKDMVRWGSNGLAFNTTNGQLFLVQSSLISSADPIPTPTAVSSPSPSPSPTPPATFVRQIPLVTGDLIYNSSKQSLYASLPSSVGVKGNSIVPIDPVTGTVGDSAFVGSEPSKLAMSDDQHTMYVALTGSGSVRRFDLNTMTPGLQFSLGNDSFSGTRNASALAVMPGVPATVAVNRSGATVIYDDDVPRSQTQNGGFPAFASPSTLYVANGPISKLSVSPSGLSLVKTVMSGSSGDIVYDNGLVYMAGGGVVDVEAGLVKGTFGFGTCCNGLMALDSAAGRVYFLSTSGPPYTLRAFDINTFLPLGSVNINLSTGGFSPTSLVRWGSNGLAFRTGSQIVLIQSALVNPSDAVPAPTPTPSPVPSPSPAYIPTFTRKLDLAANDLAFSSTSQRIYASVPSYQAAYGNSITTVDPQTGAIGPSAFIGSEPNKLALADDLQTLYVNLDGASAIRRFDTSTQTPGLQFSYSISGGPADMKVMPGNPQTVALSLGINNLNNGVAIYDDGIKRTNTGRGNYYAVGPIEFNGPSTIYGYDSYSSGFELVKFAVSSSGVTPVTITNNLIQGYLGGGLVFTNGLLYSSGGRIVDPEAQKLIGIFQGVGNGGFAIDTTLGRAFFVSVSGSSIILTAYDLNTFVPLGSATLLTNVAGTPGSLVRWGTNGLAFRVTPNFGQGSSSNPSSLYLVQSNLVSSNGSIPTGVQFSTPALFVSEGFPTATLTVNRTGDVSATTTVDYATSDGTATAGSDYTATSGTLTFAPGQLSKTLSVPIIDDRLYEGGNETFTVTLSNPVGGAVLTSPSTTVVTIQDNEQLPTIQIPSTFRSTEGNSGTKVFAVPVTLSNASIQTVSVNYATADGTATAGSDYVTTSGTLTFPPGTTTGQINVTVNGDTVIEPDETFLVKLSNPVNAQSFFPVSQATVTIANDDSSFQFAAASYSVAENLKSLNVIVTRVGDTSATALVSYATSDAAGSQSCDTVNGKASSRCDYVPAMGVLTFAPGQTSKPVTLLVIDDGFAEGDETLTMTLANPTVGILGTQATATITITDNDSVTGSNPTDTAGFYVRQNYLDFLNREPDQPGLDFWTGQMTNCGASDLTVCRVNVSGAFFLSIEFQQTGYLVERMYKVAYGDAIGTSTLGGAHQLPVPIVRFNEFLQDTQRIGRGVIVLQPGWEQALENNKQAYAAEFVATTRFTTTFPTSMSPADFVDKLNQNAGNVLSASERATAINLFANAADTSSATARAQALRQVAENQALYNAESSRAFVLAQFFGYLRRNPDDPPDTDYTGYEFWLNKLNQFNGDYIAAEMVKAFISSSEYRQRFGP